MGKPTGFMDYKRQELALRPPQERIKDWEEIKTSSLPHKEELQKQAARCMDCGIPFCHSGVMLGKALSGCPLHNLMPEFNDFVYQGLDHFAYARLNKTNNFPEFTSHVCPAPCEGACSASLAGSAVSIRNLEQYIIETAFAEGYVKPNKPTHRSGQKVAVIGSGPAGLTVAGDLAKMNFAVTILEGQSEPGGILLFGIPEFRLQKDVVRREITELLHLGVEIKTNMLVGPDFTVDDLFEQGYDAVFMGTGTSLPRTLDIPGKELSGILTATYFLRMVVLSDSGKLDESETLLHDGDNVVVIGAGNVAMDAARTAIRRGAENVTIVYHKTEAEISSFPSEYEAAVKEGVQFNFLKQPIAYLNKKQMRALNNIRRKPAESDETDLAGLLVQNITKTDDGQFVTEGGQEVIPCDCVILAIGQRPAARIVSTTKGIQVDDRGFVITRERPYGMTTRAGVFSSGDVVHGPATVVLAMKESKKVAAGIAQYIDAKKLLEDCCED